MDKTKEIPFGVKDSELCSFEYTIPDGYEAKIKDGKVIVRKAESDDEKIRKAIISFLKSPFVNESITDEKVIPWIAWLEKQGEHAKFCDSIQVGDKVTRNQDGVLVNLSQLKRVAKPADKVEPKFKVGDWVVTSYGKVNQVVSVDKDGDGYTLDDGVYFSGSWCDMYHLWTIQDAKDGDVLVSSSGKPFIFKGFFDNDPMAYGGLVADDSFWPASNSNWTTVYCKPATKEQRDLLFQKMKEAGYEWDAENKKLYKLKDVFIAEPFGERHVQEKKIVEPKQENIQDFKVLERNGKDELTEFEVAVRQLMEVVSVYGDSEMVDEDDVKSRADWLLSIARKQIVSEIDNEDIQKTAAMYTGYEQSVFFSGAESVLKTIKGE